MHAASFRPALLELRNPMALTVYGDEQRRVSFQQTQNLSLSTLVAASSRSALLELGESNDIEGLVMNPCVMTLNFAWIKIKKESRISLGHGHSVILRKEREDIVFNLLRRLRVRTFEALVRGT
ncbi:hypothetical protein V6N13_140033 [Hibiscus sabdariffa]